jgi:ATP-dependent helicase/nuclease subunit A
VTEPAQIPDQAAREAAATTFDRNVVVIAGAGTGKTTLLVNRLLYLLMRRTDPLDLSRIVALTFTNKAATEMKLRLRVGECGRPRQSSGRQWHRFDRRLAHAVWIDDR